MAGRCTNAEVTVRFTTGIDHERVGYGRCSTAEQASNGMSIEVKLRALERVAEITAHAGTDRIQHRQYNKRMQTAS